MARLLTFIAGTGFRGRACPRHTLKTEKEKANLISQTGLYLMPATTYSPTHFRVAVQSALPGTDTAGPSPGKVKYPQDPSGDH